MRGSLVRAQQGSHFLFNVIPRTHYLLSLKTSGLISIYTQKISRFVCLSRKHPDFEPGGATAEAAQPE